MWLQNDFDLKPFTERFIRYLKRNNYSTETITGYGKDLNKFSNFLYEMYQGVLLVEEIQTNDILDYLDYLKDEEEYKINSIARHLSTLKSFFKFLVQHLEFSENPACKIETPKAYIPLPPVLDFEEVEYLLEAAGDISLFYSCLISTIYYTGSRITAVRTLEKQHVDLKNQKLYFPYIKGGKDLHLPIHPKLLTLLEEHLENTLHNSSKYVFQSPKIVNSPISAADIRINLKKAAKMAGIEKRVTPHILRHSVATHLTLLGVDQTYIASILGHVDLRSTKRYQHLNVDNLRPAVEKLN